MSEYKFELSRNIERYLAALAKLYAQEGERQLQQIIVNAQIRVQEEWSHDNLDGGIWGHALYLTLPDSIYLPIARNKDELQDRIKRDLNQVQHVQREFVDEVFLEMQVAEDRDWRRESGLLVQSARIVSEDATKRIWTEGQYRLFLSHKSEVKEQTGQLKERLGRYGVSCFVAHADIEPTQEWQDEIENALATMDGFVALLTQNFHDSNWTDQEVGYAVARGVPLIAARLEKDPYGFIGKFQGLACRWENAPSSIVKLLIKQDRMLSAYIGALKACKHFDTGNVLADILPAITKLTEQQIEEIVEAYNANPSLRRAFGFNGERPVYYGSGLLEHVNRLSTNTYLADRDGGLVTF